MKRLLRFWAIVVPLLVGIPEIAVGQAVLEGPYENPVHQEVSFGQRSFYLAPWRSYMDTRNSDSFLDGLGFVWNGNPQDADAVFRIFAEKGFRHVRIEYGWGDIVFAPDRDGFPEHHVRRMETVLQAAKKHGLRPIILLNAHHGNPCPNHYRDVFLVEDAPEGAREVRLSSTDGIRIDYTGIVVPSRHKRPGMFITKLDGDRCTLSMPLPVALKAEQKIGLATLKYRPFSGAEFEDGRPNPAAEETLQGWRNYVAAICAIAHGVLKSEESSGFDLEVWNEYSFGSDFLDINRYYDPPLKFKKPVSYEKHGRRAEGTEIILPMTVDYCNDPANGLRGVKVISGFANQRPWDNGTELWPGQAGFSRHYYTNAETVHWHGRGPEGDRHSPSGPINALGRRDGIPDGKEWHTVEPGSYFVPDHLVCLPEYWHFAYQTEFITRDLQPFPGPFEKHFRFSNPGTGRYAEVWMTETNTWRQPWADALMKKHDLKAEDPRLRHLMDKFAEKVLLRYSVFYTHKGVRTLTYYAAREQFTGFGMLPPEFFEQLKSDDGTLTETSRDLVGSQLTTLGRVAGLMKEGKTISVTRPLGVERLVEHDPRLVFKGDGTPGHPDRFHRDDFACLPYQLDADRFAVAYYVVTRNLLKSWDEERDELDPARYDMPEQEFDLTLSNVRGAGAEVAIWDPRTDEILPVEILATTDTTLNVRLSTRDWPRFLLIKEDRPGPMILDPKFRADTEAGLSFRTNVPVAATITWGYPPYRTGNSRTLAVGDSPEVSLGKDGFVPGMAVRVEIEKNGLRAVWPRWGDDVQGKSRFDTVATKGEKRPPDVRWPALPSTPRPKSYRIDLPEGLRWIEENRSLTLGAADSPVLVRLRSTGSTETENLLPDLSASDRCRVTATQWKGYPAWEVELRFDPTAHPGLKETYRREFVLPLADGMFVLSIEGSEPAVQGQKQAVESLREAFRFDAP